MGKLIGGGIEGFIVIQNTEAANAWLIQALRDGEIFRHRKRWQIQRFIQSRPIIKIYLTEIH